MEITWEHTINGYSAFCGPLKVAVLGTKQDQGLVRNGVIIYEPMACDTWGLHFTSPQMSVTLLRAILDSLPTEA